MDLNLRNAMVVAGCTLAGAIVGYICQRALERRGNVDATVMPVEFQKPEMVYGYDEAVERAKEKLANGGEDGVRAIGPMPNPLVKADGIPWNEDQSSIDVSELRVTEAEMTAYHQIAEPYSQEEPSKVEDPRPQLPQEDAKYKEADIPDVKPWPAEKDGKWFGISEDKFRHEEPWFDKMSATYFTLDRVLAGYDEKLEPLEEEQELLRRCFTIANGDNNEGSAYFRNLDEERDVEVVFSDAKWLEAQEEAL